MCPSDPRHDGLVAEYDVSYQGITGPELDEVAFRSLSLKELVTRECNRIDKRLAGHHP